VGGVKKHKIESAEMRETNKRLSANIPGGIMGIFTGENNESHAKRGRPVRGCESKNFRVNGKQRERA